MKSKSSQRLEELRHLEEHLYLEEHPHLEEQDGGLLDLRPMLPPPTSSLYRKSSLIRFRHWPLGG